MLRNQIGMVAGAVGLALLIADVIESAGETVSHDKLDLLYRVRDRLVHSAAVAQVFLAAEVIDADPVEYEASAPTYRVMKWTYSGFDPISRHITRYSASDIQSSAGARGGALGSYADMPM